MSKQKDFIIDVDKAIEAYNKNNPELKKLDREELRKELGINFTQIFSDWKGKAPKAVSRIMQISEITGADVEVFVHQKEE